MKLAITVQEAETALVVYVVPDKVPPQVPPTLAVYPPAAVTVKLALLPAAIVCTVVGEMLPLAPVLGVTVTFTGVLAAVKLAWQVEFAASVTCVLAAVPVQLPDHPEKVAPLVGAAVKVTTVFCANAAEQVLPQAIPAGLDVTVPVPVPDGVTYNVNCGAG